MLYIDTSSLFKLLWQETQSEWTRQRIAAEQKVVLSSLAELEADVQLKDRQAGPHGRSPNFPFLTFVSSVSLW